MSKDMIRVRAAEGLRVFFPQIVTAGPGRVTKILEGEEIIEVSANMRFVRRSIRCGDLTVVKTEGKPKPKLKPKASKPETEADPRRTRVTEKEQ